MARWTASAKWAAGPALDGQRDTPLALTLSEVLGLADDKAKMNLNSLGLPKPHLRRQARHHSEPAAATVVGK